MCGSIRNPCNVSLSPSTTTVVISMADLIEEVVIWARGFARKTNFRRYQSDQPTVLSAAYSITVLQYVYMCVAHITVLRTFWTDWHFRKLSSAVARNLEPRSLWGILHPTPDKTVRNNCGSRTASATTHCVRHCPPCIWTVYSPYPVYVVVYRRTSAVAAPGCAQVLWARLGGHFCCNCCECCGRHTATVRTSACLTMPLHYKSTASISTPVYIQVYTFTIITGVAAMMATIY